RGEVRAISLQHELAERGLPNGLANVIRFFKSDDSRETDKRAKSSDSFLDRGRFGKAMKHPAELIRVRFENGQGSLQRGALMNDHVQFEFGGHAQMLVKQFGLALFIDNIILRLA